MKTPTVMAESMRVIGLAARVLERPNADPDDDLAILARQFTRCRERNGALLASLRTMVSYMEDAFDDDGTWPTAIADIAEARTLIEGDRS